jgi:hypothetical protein
MLYYAGHGLQLDWHNFMVPVDAKLDEASDVPKQTIDIESVIDVLKKSGTRMNIIVLDACRDNPFAEKASGKGLAQLDAPPGTYLAFATSPGNVAEDGDVASGNGLFTQFLLKELQRPAKIEDVFKRVRLQVRQKSQGRQIPWDSSSLEDDFAFNDGKRFTFNPEDLIKEAQLAKDKEAKLKQEAEAAIQREKDIAAQQALEKQRLAEAQKIKETAARQKAEAEAKERERQLALAAEQERLKAQAAAQALERARAEEVQRLLDIEQAKLQLAEEARRSKLSQEAAREQQFAQEKADWDKIKDSKNVKDFYAFLLKYPSGFITEQAQFAVEQLSGNKLLPQANITGEKIVENKIRYRVGDLHITKVTDLNSGVLIRQESKTVQRIEGNQVFVNVENGTDIQIMTLDGGLIKHRNTQATVSFDPPRIDLPGDELRVGKKWTSRTIEFNESRSKKAVREDHVEITAHEELTVPAGTFKAYKLVMKSKIDNGTSVLATYWVEPGWGFKIKAIRQVERKKGNSSYEVHEMVSRLKGPV